MGGDRDWRKDDKSGIDAVDKVGNFVQVVSACFFFFFSSSSLALGLFVCTRQQKQVRVGHALFGSAIE